MKGVVTIPAVYENAIPLATSHPSKGRGAAGFLRQVHFEPLCQPGDNTLTGIPSAYIIDLVTMRLVAQGRPGPGIITPSRWLSREAPAIRRVPVLWNPKTRPDVRTSPST